MADYDKLLNKLSPGVWYDGASLNHLWKVPTEIRKTRVAYLTKKKMLMRRGRTANVQYRIYNPLAAEVKTVPTPAAAPTTLDELIKAATDIGTENTIMRKALQEAKAIISKALESTK